MICIRLIQKGYFPNKLHTVLLYNLYLNTYYVYAAISSGLIWASHANKLLIHLSFNEEFYESFIVLFKFRRNNKVNDETLHKSIDTKNNVRSDMTSPTI